LRIHESLLLTKVISLISEIRPAPHMDNLVTCFKSMEVAAGVNIFTTQVGPSTKNPGNYTTVN